MASEGKVRIYAKRKVAIQFAIKRHEIGDMKRAGGN